MYFCIKRCIWTQGEVGRLWNCFNPPPTPPTPPPPPPGDFFSTDHSKAVIPVLVLLFVALWFILRGNLFWIFFCSCVCLFSIAITLLGEERATLSAFRMFVRFAFVWFCLFPLPLGVWVGLRLVIVVLPGLFSYLLFSTKLAITVLNKMAARAQTRKKPSYDSLLHQALLTPSPRNCLFRI